MGKFILNIVFLLILFSGSAGADIIDAPHNVTNMVSCSSCHKYSLWWRYSPVYGDTMEHESVTNDVCMTCHASGGSAPYVNFHSSEAIGGQHRDEIGPWSKPCVACHDPHIQAQLDWLAIDPSVDSKLFFVTATIAPNSIIANEETTTFEYIATTVNNEDWADPSLWTQKTSAGRGLILVVPKNTAENTYEISAVSDGADGKKYVTVQGVIDASNSGKEFGIMYGQLIRYQIDGVQGPKSIQFFDPTGDFVNTDTGEGLCQVCHTKTFHFRYDGSAPDQNHSNIFDAPNQKCTRCHQHNSGFGHGGNGSGDCADCHNTNNHPVHLGFGAVCADCHGNGPVRDGNGEVIIDPLSAESCNACHQDGKGGLPNDITYRQNWANPDYSTTCASCHNGRKDAEMTKNCKEALRVHLWYIHDKVFY